MHLMNHLKLKICSRFVIGWIFATTCLSGDARTEELVTYSSHIRPIFKKHCVGCHNANRSSAGLDLSSYAAIMRGSNSGDVVVGGDPTDSFLYLVAAHTEEPAMPPNGKKISNGQLQTLKTWIEGGLRENETSEPIGVKSASNMSAPPAVIDAPAVDSSRQEKSDSPSVRAELTLGPVYRGLHSTANKALATHAEQKLIAVGAQLQVLLFDAESYQLKATLPFPEGEPQVLRFSPDGARLLAGGGIHAQSGRVVLWDTATGQRLWEGGDEYDVVMATDISPDGRYVVLGGPDRIIKVLSTESDEVVHRIEKHTDWMLAARFGAEGLIFATADRDGGVYIWETESGELIHSLRGHKGPVHSIDFPTDQDVCITASEDGSIRWWDLHSGKQTNQVYAHADGVMGIAMSDSGRIISAGRDQQCMAWSSSEAVAIKQLSSLPISIAALDNQSCVISLHDGTHTIWNYSQDELAQLDLPENLLTNDLTDVIPANFVSVRPRKQVAPPATEQTSLDSDLFRMAIDFEQRLRLANERIPAMTSQVGSLREKIKELETHRVELEASLAENLAELEAAESQLRTLMSELDQMFEASE